MSQGNLTWFGMKPRRMLNAQFQVCNPGLFQKNWNKLAVASRFQNCPWSLNTLRIFVSLMHKVQEKHLLNRSVLMMVNICCFIK